MFRFKRSRSFASLENKADLILSGLTELKAQVDTLNATVPKLLTALTTAQEQAASVQKKLDAALANADDPVELQAIKDELTALQSTVDGAVTTTAAVTAATDATTTATAALPEAVEADPVVVTQAAGPTATQAATIAAHSTTGPGNL